MNAQTLIHERDSSPLRPGNGFGPWPGAGAGDDRCIAMLAHELRDPLNAVVLALHALRPACDEEPETRAARELAEHGSRHMARIIDDVLDLCRGDRGKLSLRREQVDLSRVVAAAVATARPLIAAAGHHLAVSLPAAPVSVEAHPSRLEQILTNLLSNAARYTDPGGHIWLSAEASADTLVVRVRDDGTGIDPELLPHVFDPYRQGPQPRDRPRGGLGIGLALVKSLVELHGGEVTAHSDGPGTGSEFVVRLPARASLITGACGAPGGPGGLGSGAAAAGVVSARHAQESSPRTFGESKICEPGGEARALTQAGSGDEMPPAAPCKQ